MDDEWATGEESETETTHIVKKQLKEKTCNPRIDELSTPARRMFLALWNDHAHHLPKDKVKNLKHILQQAYAMTPEETAKYFSELRAESKAQAMRRKVKRKLRKYLLQKCNEKQKQRAYKLFRKLLRCGISYAAQNPIPPVVSLRLRYLSDVILEQLCEIREVEKPCRCNNDRSACFLISVADWMAIAVERLYFAAQVTINELNSPEEQIEVPNTYQEMGRALASSSPRQSLDQPEVPATYQGMGPPLASSSRRHSSNEPMKYSDFGIPCACSTPKKIALTQNVKETESDLNPYYSILESEPLVIRKIIKMQNKFRCPMKLKPPSMV